jgi:hypothetical protein
MVIERTLLKEIEDSKRWLDIEKDDSTYKRDLAKKERIIPILSADSYIML